MTTGQKVNVVIVSKANLRVSTGTARWFGGTCRLLRGSSFLLSAAEIVPEIEPERA